MLPSILNNNWQRFNALLIIIAILYACVLTAVLIDLYFGVKRAKRQKIARTSFGYRRTITKLTSYFGLLLMFSIIDIAASVILNMPYFTVIGTIGIILVETKSVLENIKQTEKNVAEVQKLLHNLFDNKEQIQALITYLNTQPINTQPPNPQPQGAA